MDWGSMGPGEEWVNSAAHEPERGKTQERSKSVSDTLVWFRVAIGKCGCTGETEEVDGQTLCDKQKLFERVVLCILFVCLRKKLRAQCVIFTAPCCHELEGKRLFF